MSKRSGTLLWRRMQFGSLFLDGLEHDIDTGLTQVGQALGPDEPPIDGNIGPSRIMVLVLQQFIPTANIQLKRQPFIDPVTNTVHVLLQNTGDPTQGVSILFWDPHTLIGPGQADPYAIPD